MPDTTWAAIRDGSSTTFFAPSLSGLSSTVRRCLPELHPPMTRPGVTMGYF
jgi:hypothetical protein